MEKRFAIVLAAGKGTRMKSSLYKVLHPVCGKAMVEHVVDQVEQAGATRIVSIVGFGAEAVQQLLQNRCEYAVQAEQLGTGHAVKQAAPLLAQEQGTTLVICGDTPLISAEIIRELMAHHQKNQAQATILTAHATNPFGYGRVIRDEKGHVLKNVEQKDATPEEAAIQEINTGTYVFDNQALFEALEQVTNHNAQGEYYLPDVLAILREKGAVVTAYQMADVRDSLGVNDRVALAEATKLMRQRINTQHMKQGVTLIDPDTTYIDATVTIQADTTIGPGVVLQGNTHIGSGCAIEAHSVLRDMIVADGVVVRTSYLENSTMANDSNAGPYAHLRPNSQLGERVHIGNFVEVKNSTIAADTKVGHLSYIGDADLAERINVGCGTIFVNYDGKNKHRSTVGADSFIGCDANIVSPVTIGEHAFIAAGSTITRDVPDEALAIARSRQENKEQYVQRLPISDKK